ncbi:hypothetical protein B0I35DRAFT_105272 [Stachybotrys elegans]|uniref:Uncharacterized protein n=1 Tax=Stachybotrys elegans TaxID=80388 RepID=A0A8K0SF42_9HYPO|nr:hypothetical protein B0I35DRAFT_105272 [Stachybotrys elegans]
MKTNENHLSPCAGITRASPMSASGLTHELFAHVKKPTQSPATRQSPREPHILSRPPPIASPSSGGDVWHHSLVDRSDIIIQGMLSLGFKTYVHHHHSAHPRPLRYFPEHFFRSVDSEVRYLPPIWQVGKGPDWLACGQAKLFAPISSQGCCQL